jgi:hypothetical protein
MKTRSQSKSVQFQEHSVDIDFDEASEAWNANKKKLSNGCYQYVCGKPISDGGFCKKKNHKNSTHCYMHSKKGV